MTTSSPSVPACRVGVSEQQLQREAERAVLYAACLLAVRPSAPIKAELREAATALQPAVSAYFAAEHSPQAAHAAAYADAAGGRAFLDAKAAIWRQRHSLNAEC